MHSTIIDDRKSLIPLTVTAAAPRLGAHPETLRRHLRSGSIRGIKLGHWRIPADEMARLEGHNWAEGGDLQ
jgi:excisionase family DNA binding protein